MPPDGKIVLPRALTPGLLQHCAVQLCAISCATKPLDRFRIPEPSCNARERVELIALRLGREEKQEDDIYRFAINGIEVDRVLETNQCAEWFLQIGYPSMRDGDTATRTGGPQVLAFE